MIQINIVAVNEKREFRRKKKERINKAFIRLNPFHSTLVPCKENSESCSEKNSADFSNNRSVSSGAFTLYNELTRRVALIKLATEVGMPTSEK